MMQILAETIVTPDAAAWRQELHRTGTIMLPPDALFTSAELAEIERLCASVPEEVIKIGDAGEPNDLYVGRFMIDMAGERPRTVNPAQSDRLLAILNAPRRHDFFLALLQGQRFMRRCQVNRMVAGSFIGRHLDTDSNPDYDVSVVIQIGRHYQGGAFVVYPDDAPPNVFQSHYGSVIVSQCRFEHEVAKVISGERISLVYFYSPYAMENRRK